MSPEHAKLFNAAKRRVRALEDELVNRLAIAARGLDAHTEAGLVLHIFRADLQGRLDAHVAAGRRTLIDRFHTWADKYALVLHDFDVQCDVAATRIDIQLEEFLNFRIDVAGAGAIRLDGEIPSGWQVRSLASLATIGTGLALGRELGTLTSIELPYLRVANVQDGYVDTSDLKTVRVLRSEVDRYRLEPGDVLLTEGGDFDKLGRGAVWNGSIADCLHQNHIFRVRFHDAVIPEYFALYIASSVGRSYFLSCAKQTTNLASINKTQLSAMPVAYPPVDEQRRIVSPLNQLAMRLTLEERRRRKLELIHRGLMDDLLTGRARLLVTGGGRS